MANLLPPELEEAVAVREALVAVKRAHGEIGRGEAATRIIARTLLATIEQGLRTTGQLDVSSTHYKLRSQLTDAVNDEWLPGRRHAFAPGEIYTALINLGKLIGGLSSYTFRDGRNEYTIDFAGPTHHQRGDWDKKHCYFVPIIRLRNPIRSVLRYQRLTFPAGWLQAARFVPGESSVWYAASWHGQDLQLFSTRLDSVAEVRQGPAGAGLLAISPPDVAVALDQCRWGPWPEGRLGTRSLSPSLAKPGTENVMFADYGPNGAGPALALRGVHGYSLRYEPLAVDLSTEGWFSHVRVSPQGDMLAAIHHPSIAGTEGTIRVFWQGGRFEDVTPVFKHALGLAWSPHKAQVLATVDLSRQEKALVAVNIHSHEVQTLLCTPGYMTIHDISRSGAALLSTDDIRVCTAGRRGPTDPMVDLSLFDWTHGRDISADGSVVLLGESGDAACGDYNIYVRGLGDGLPQFIGKGTATSLSPDGQWVLAHSLVSEPSPLKILPVGTAGSCQARPSDQSGRLISDGIHHSFGSWTPDSRHVVFVGNKDGEASQLFLYSLDENVTRELTTPGIRIRTVYPVTCDGAHVCAQRSSGRHVLIPLVSGQPEVELPGLEPEDYPICWGFDKRLYCFRIGDRVCRVWSCDPFRGGRELCIDERPPDSTGLCTVNLVRVAPKTGSFIFTYMKWTSTLYLVTGLF